MSNLVLETASGDIMDEMKKTLEQYGIKGHGEVLSLQIINPGQNKEICIRYLPIDDKYGHAEYGENE